MSKIAIMKAFVVDDDPFSRELYKHYLMNNGICSVSCFDNGQECINQLTEQPDIIFLDYHMHSLNGLDVLKKIKRFDPNIIIILISAQSDVKVAVNALKYGAFDYIVKGENDLQAIDTVLHKIETLLVVEEEKKKTPLFIKGIKNILTIKK